MSSVVFLAAFGFFVVRVMGNGDGGEAAPSPLPRETSYQPMLTPDRLDKLTAAVRHETGDVQVLSVWLESDGTARLTAPPEEPGDLAETYRWEDGVLEKWTAEQAGERQPFPLDVILPEVIVDLDEEARDRSDGDISSSRTHIEKPVRSTDDWIYLTVEEVDHGGVTLWADWQGKVTGDLVNENWRDD